MSGTAMLYICLPQVIQSNNNALATFNVKHQATFNVKHQATFNVKHQATFNVKHQATFNVKHQATSFRKQLDASHWYHLIYIISL